MEFLPWYNKNLIQFLKLHLTSSMSVFEYGGGNSTLFYARYVAHVCTIESKQEWFNFIKEKSTKFSLPNITIKICDNLLNFPNEIENFRIKKFDLIVIDSRDRIKCLEKSVSFLKKSGSIILDNSERENLKSAANLMKNFGFYETIFSGIRNDGVYSQSSFFAKVH
jgi:precorrin-6B methylase 2